MLGKEIIELWNSWPTWKQGIIVHEYYMLKCQKIHKFLYNSFHTNSTHLFQFLFQTFSSLFSYICVTEKWIWFGFDSTYSLRLYVPVITEIVAQNIKYNRTPNTDIYILLRTHFYKYRKCSFVLFITRYFFPL